MRPFLIVLPALVLMASPVSVGAETAPPSANAVTQHVFQLLQAEKISEAKKEYTQYYSNFPDPERKEAIRASLQAVAGIVIEQLDKQGLTLIAGRRLDDAKAAFEKGLRLREEIFGKESTGVAVSLNNIGLALFVQGKPDEAEPILRSAISLRERLEGSNSAGLVGPLTTLGGVLASEKRFSEAEVALQRALTINQSVGGSARERIVILRNLGALYTNQGKTDQAQSALLEANKLEQQGNSTHP
jgi:tetratricopeptide (TPR) repeat protein